MNWPPLTSNVTLHLSVPSGVSVMAASNGLPWKLPANLSTMSVPLLVMSVTFCVSGCIWFDISAMALPPSSLKISSCSNVPCGESRLRVHVPANMPRSATVMPCADGMLEERASTTAIVPMKRAICDFL